MIKLDDLIGKPYQLNGRGPNSFDCWGLCLEIAKRLCRCLPEYDVPKSGDEQKALVSVAKGSGFKRLVQPEPWCLVAFRIWDDKGKEKWHIGTVLENCRKFIHITGKGLVCISPLNHKLWHLFLEGFYSYAS